MRLRLLYTLALMLGLGTFGPSSECALHACPNARSASYRACAHVCSAPEKNASEREASENKAPQSVSATPVLHSLLYI